MTFTTPCFVRVENPEKRNNLREWAKNIGYNFVDVAGIESDYSDPQPYIEVFPHSFRSTTPQGNSFYVASRKAIDCGDNIELFKALAAMTDGPECTEQYLMATANLYVLKRGKVKQLAAKGELLHNDVIVKCGGVFSSLRKATAEEIVEYFKNKER